jgi:hypothetical protein
MKQKINSVSSAETKGDSSTTAELNSSSPNNAKPNVGGSFCPQDNDTEINPIKINSYPNAETFKYKNSRVQVVSLPTKDYSIELTILSDNLTPRALHKVKKDKIVVTGVRISKEAALSIMIGLQQQLRKDGVI